MKHRRTRYITLTVIVACLWFCVSGFLSWQARVRHTQSGVSLGELKLSILEYAQDNGGRLPPMNGRTRFIGALLPYTKSFAAFYAFDDHSRLYLPNPRLSGRRVNEVTRLTVLLYEAKPAKADGSRWVAFLPENAVPVMFADPDFRDLELMKEANWQRLKTASGIP